MSSRPAIHAKDACGPSGRFDKARQTALSCCAHRIRHDRRSAHSSKGLSQCCRPPPCCKYRNVARLQRRDLGEDLLCNRIGSPPAVRCARYHSATSPQARSSSENIVCPPSAFARAIAASGPGRYSSRRVTGSRSSCSSAKSTPGGIGDHQDRTGDAIGARTSGQNMPRLSVGPETRAQFFGQSDPEQAAWGFLPARPARSHSTCIVRKIPSLTKTHSSRGSAAHSRACRSRCSTDFRHCSHRASRSLTLLVVGFRVSAVACAAELRR